MPDEIVELADRVVVVVVVDAAEAHAEGVRRPQLGEKLAAPGAEALEHRGQHPLLDHFGRKRRVERRHRRVGDRRAQPQHDAVGTAIRLGDPRLADLDLVAERLQRRAVEHDLALLRVELGGRKVVDELPGQHVDQLDVGVADDEALGRPDRDADLQRESHARSGGGDHLVQFRHRVLHREGAGDGARAVVTVEPAGDGVAAEVDDVPAVAVEFGNEGVEDPVQVRRQHFGAALRSEFVGQCLGQRREAGDVREQRRTVHGMRDRRPRREREPAVAGDVGIGVVEAGIPRCRLVRRISLCVGHRFLIALAATAARGVIVGAGTRGVGPLRIAPAGARTRAVAATRPKG